MTLEEIGKFIRFLRKNSKLTQEELVRRVGLNRSTIGRLERCDSNIKIKNLLLFLDQFGYELSLMSRDDDSTDPVVVKIADQIYNTMALNFGHTRETKAKFGWSYIIKPVNERKPIKIGYTQQNHPNDRLIVLNTNNPKKYEVYYALLDMDCRSTEKTMLLEYDSNRLKGEWFNVDCDIAKAKLKSIVKYEVV